MEIPQIVAVYPQAEKKLLVEFNNGIKKLYDCGPLFELDAFRLLRTDAFFKAVKVDPGGYGISWNDTLDLSEYELWTRGVEVHTTL